MASMQGHFRPSHNPKPHMLAGPLGCIRSNAIWHTCHCYLMAIPKMAKVPNSPARCYWISVWI